MSRNTKKGDIELCPECNEEGPFYAKQSRCIKCCQRSNRESYARRKSVAAREAQSIEAQGMIQTATSTKW